MKTMIFSAVVGLLMSAQAMAEVRCYNRETTGKQSLVYKQFKTKATLTFKGEKCNMLPMEYNPRNGKYYGWIRFASDKKNCRNLGKVLFGDSMITKKPIEIYWVSVSREVQKDRKGFLQVGYENDADPGAGAVSKLNLGCFPTNK